MLGLPPSISFIVCVDQTGRITGRFTSEVNVVFPRDDNTKFVVNIVVCAMTA
jgi:hypothetical protein